MMYDNLYEITRREYEVRLPDETLLEINVDEHNFTAFYQNKEHGVFWDEVVPASPLEVLAKLILKETENGR
mgnify:FL=1